MALLSTPRQPMAAESGPSGQALLACAAEVDCAPVGLSPLEARLVLGLPDAAAARAALTRSAEAAPPDATVQALTPLRLNLPASAMSADLLPDLTQYNLPDLRWNGDGVSRPARAINGWRRQGGDVALWLVAPPQPGDYTLRDDVGATLARVTVTEATDIHLRAPSEARACDPVMVLFSVPRFANAGLVLRTEDGQTRQRRDLDRAPFDQARRLTLKAPRVPGRYVIGFDLTPHADGLVAPTPLTVTPGPCEASASGQATGPAARLWPATAFWDPSARPRADGGTGTRLQAPPVVTRGDELSIRAVGPGVDGSMRLRLERARTDGGWDLVQAGPMTDDGVAWLALWPAGETYRLTLSGADGLGRPVVLDQRPLAVTPASGPMDVGAIGARLSVSIMEPVATASELAFDLRPRDPGLWLRWARPDGSLLQPWRPLTGGTLPGGPLAARSTGLLRAPSEPGTYVLEIGHTALGETVLLRHPVEVTPPFDVAARRAALSITLPERLEAGTEFRVNVTPEDAEYRIIIRDAAGAVDAHSRADGAPADRPLLAPAQPGSYTLEVTHARLPGMVLGQDSLSVAAPFEVAERRADVSWTVPASIVPGGTLSVPVTPMDARYYLELEALDGPAAGRRTVGPSPASLAHIRTIDHPYVHMPLRPGRYRLRLRHDQVPETDLLSAAVTAAWGVAPVPAVQPDTLTVAGCETLSVDWTAPAHADWLVGLADPARPRAFADVQVTADAALPMALNVPRRPGLYEVRLERGGETIIAGVPVVVAPATDPSLCESGS